MHLRLISILRWAVPALLFLGLSGLGGCSQRSHPQYAHALGGGGAIGKGPSDTHKGKRRGIGQRDVAGAFGTSSKSKSDPFAGMGAPALGKKDSASTRKSSPPAGARPNRSPKPKSLFDSASGSERKRTADPFKDF